MAISVVDTQGSARAACVPAPLRIGLLGLGTVGSAVARRTRLDAATFHDAGFAPVVSVALVRDAAKARTATAFAATVTSNPGVFFDSTVDIVIEALGGEEPARSLVERALDRGIPVVTANKTLVAAHGDTLAALARRRGTALRYEASCMAGVPFLGTYERRPLAARARGFAAILNGTSNAILSALAAGGGFDAALADAQQRGYAEPDATADITGADAAQKLAILLRLFARRRVHPAAIACTAIDIIDGLDFQAAALCGGTIKPLACAGWDDDTTRAFVSPAFLPLSHPLAAVSQVTNGLVLDAPDGVRCLTGPGAGPDVTAVSLLDDAIELATERAPRPPAAAASVPVTPVRPATRWFLRIDTPGDRRDEGADTGIADVLGTFGLWCERTARIAARRYALTYAAPPDRVAAATSAIRAALGATVTAIPAIEEASC